MKKLLASVVVATASTLTAVASADAPSVQFVRYNLPILSAPVQGAYHSITFPTSGRPILRTLVVQTLTNATSYSAQLTGGTSFALTSVSLN